MSAETITTLHRTVQAGGPAAVRAKIILLARQGRSDVSIAAELGIARQTVARWRRRFDAGEGDGAATLADAPRSGRPAAPELPVLLATAAAPPDGDWTATGLAAGLGLSAATVRRVWRRWGVVTQGGAWSEAGVLATEIERFGGIFLNGADGAFAYWIRTGEPSSPTPALPEFFDGLGDLLDADTSRDDCFPERRDLEFEQFLDQLDAVRPGGTVLRVVVSAPAMTDSDVIMNWLDRPDVLVEPPRPPIDWPGHLGAVIAAVLGPERGPTAAPGIRDRVERLRRSATGSREPIRWIP